VLKDRQPAYGVMNVSRCKAKFWDATNQVSRSIKNTFVISRKEKSPNQNGQDFKNRFWRKLNIDRGYQFETSTRRGVRLRWTHVERGREVKPQVDVHTDFRLWAE